MPELLNDDEDDNEAALALAIEIADALVEKSTRESFLQRTLPDLLKHVEVETGGLVSQRQGTWHRDFWQGESAASVEDLVAEAIDQGTIRITGQWCIAPLQVDFTVSTTMKAGVGSSSALVLKTNSSSPDIQSINQVVKLLSYSLVGSESYRHQSRRVDQLTAVLSAAAEWQRLDDNELLLRKIADAATSLLPCERASIFLWDRRRSKLIGWPALGIEDDKLEVAADAGVVGEVLKTGEAKIWNGNSDDESRVNRRVDARLEFQTQSLVAVPMSSGRGDLIGVFEAINAVDHEFDDMDVAVLSDLATHAAVAIESLRTRKRLTLDRDRLVEDAAAQTPLIGDHRSITDVRKQASKVAGTDLTVLVLGKNGTGKEVLARMIHYESKRRTGPFIAVNCAALVESLLESELFGHEKGAFTDANQTHVGKFELASGGTLFLDEVGDMSPGGQAKLLRVLEEKVVVRVGGSQAIPVDVRVIAATNQPLEDLILARRFREDLFFRLNVVSLTLPPLSARGDDVLLLAEHFLNHFCYQIGRQVPQFDAVAKKTLIEHSWPGNIRELRNTIERVCYLCSENTIAADDLMIGGGRPVTDDGGSITSNITANSLTDATKEFQVIHIQDAIKTCGGNMTDAAERLGLHRSNLYRKMRQLDMPTSGE